MYDAFIGGGLTSWGNCLIRLTSSRIEIFTEDNLVIIPHAIPIEIAASFTVSSYTAYSIVRKLSLKDTDKVLIMAASSNTSLAVINIIKDKYDLTVLTTTESNFNKLKSLGLKNIILFNKQNRHLALNRIIKQGGVDAVFDPYCDLYLETAIELLNFNGKYVTCGYINQIRDTNYNDNIFSFYKCIKLALPKNLSIMSNCLGDIEDINTAIKDFEKGRYNVIVDSIYSYGQEKEFLEKLLIIR